MKKYTTTRFEKEDCAMSVINDGNVVIFEINNYLTDNHESFAFTKEDFHYIKTLLTIIGNELEC